MNHAYIDSFLEYLTVERSSPENTLAAYESDLRHFFSWLEEKGRTSSVSTRGDMAEYSHACRQMNLKSTSISRRLSAVRRFYRFLLDRADSQRPDQGPCCP
jgi:site-specific recombinase XerD